MSFKTLLLVLFCIGNPASASVISHYGYSYDSTTSITTGDGLQWLHWDVTAGMSIDQALATYSADGWHLAGNSQVVNIMQVFFPMYNWLPTLDENTRLGVFVSVADTDYYRHFGQIFGLTFNDGFSWTTALFGHDEDSDGYYRSVWGAYTDYEPVVAIEGDIQDYTRDYQASDVGIALVRSIPISEPASLSLMLLIGLFWPFKKR